MAIAKIGTRKITVENESYRWLIRRKATYSQSDHGNGYLHVAVEHADKLGAVLVIYTGRKHPKDWSTIEVVPVTPSDVAKWIKQALKLGWKPSEEGKQYPVEVIGDEMIVLEAK